MSEGVGYCTEVKPTPSPFEVSQKMTARGGWLRYDLNSWGVPWPPPSGWKSALEQAYMSGRTVGLIQECDICETAVYVAESGHPCWCEKCEKEVERRRDERRKQIFNIPQIVVNGRYKKQTIHADLRWLVWERDNYTCKHCGSRKHLTVDHIYPEVKGGTLDLDNLQTLCKSCNSRKGAR